MEKSFQPALWLSSAIDLNGSLRYSDVYKRKSGRCRSLSFILKYFLSFYLSRFSFIPCHRTILRTLLLGTTTKSSVLKFHVYFNDKQQHSYISTLSSLEYTAYSMWELTSYRLCAALRMSVRSSLYDRTNKAAHQHQFGAETYNADDDTYTHTCTTCDYTETFEKMWATILL